MDIGEPRRYVTGGRWRNHEETVAHGKERDRKGGGRGKDCGRQGILCDGCLGKQSSLETQPKSCKDTQLFATRACHKDKAN